MPATLIEYVTSSAVSTSPFFPAANRELFTFTAATWTEGALTLSAFTPAPSFGSTRLNGGTRVVITGGTGATPGNYVASGSGTNANVVLTASIGAGADGLTNMTGSIVPAHVITATFSASVFGAGDKAAWFYGLWVLDPPAAAQSCQVVDQYGGVIWDFQEVQATAAGSNDRTLFVPPNPIYLKDGFGLQVSSTTLRVVAGYQVVGRTL